MKKFLTVIAIFALVFAGCEQPPNEDGSGGKLPSLTIRNNSSYDLTNVEFSGITFSVSGSNDLPASSQSAKQLTVNDLNKTGYITFTRKDIGINLRTEEISITNQDYTFTFLDTTVVEEVENVNNKEKTLAQITFLSTVIVERGGLAVAKGGTEPLGEAVVNVPLPFEFTLKNTGVGKLLFTETQPVKITGEGSDVFTVVQPSSPEIAPGSLLTFRITFTPTAVQNYSGLVTISSNDQDGDFTFTITAAGTPSKPIAKVFYDNTEILQNGTINAGEAFLTQSKNFTVEISNTGTEVLNLDVANIIITGDNEASFTRISMPATSIAVNSSTSFDIQFSPTVEGENNTILEIPTNDVSRNPVVVLLKGTGVKGSAVLELTQTSTGRGVIENHSPIPVDFGRIELASGSSQTLLFTINNTGNIPLALAYTSATSSSPAFAIQSQPAIKTLAPGANTTFDIRFTPNAEGDLAATITIDNDSDEGTFTFAVSGTGFVKRPQVEIYYEETEISQNGTIDAGEVLLTLSQNITVTIKNTGEVALSIDQSGISITGADAQAFRKATNPGINLQPGGTASFTIECTPVKVGENIATLTIPTNDPNRPNVIVTLKATGV